jgi:hypothetical protein
MPLTPTQVRYLEILIGVSRRPATAGADGATPVPETVILRRWRALTSKAMGGSSYHGCRLPPSLWRLVRAMLELDARLAQATVERVEEVMMGVRATAKRDGQYLGSVPAEALRELLKFLCRGKRLERILAAHAGDTRYGVTDLLLYRIRNGKALDFRFVEVKRHNETVRTDQVAELEMLRALKLTAGIVRLETPRKPAPVSARQRGSSHTAAEPVEATAAGPRRRKAEKR